MYENKYHNIDISKYTFLVTGGAGFIGSNLVEYLLKWGAKKVRVLDDLSNGYLENINEFMDNSSFEFIEGDIRDPEICKMAVQGMDYISHQAALGSVPRSIEDPVTTNSVNIDGHLNILIAAKESSSLNRMVYAASSSSYGDSKKSPKVEGEEGNPLSPYAITKWVNELYANTFSNVYGFHTIGLRYFNVFGPKQNPNNAYAAVIPVFMKAIRDGKQATINGDGKTSRDFTFVENVIQANIKALLNTPKLHKHEVLNVAVGESTSLNNLWDEINEVAQKNIKVLYGPERKGDVKHSLANIEKSKKLLGYEPKIRCKQGIELTYCWNIKQDYDYS